MRNSLRKLEGIHHIEVDLEFEEAIVRYSPDVVGVDAMIEATTAIGFPSAIKVEQTGAGKHPAEVTE